MNKTNQTPLVAITGEQYADIVTGDGNAPREITEREEIERLEHRNDELLASRNRYEALANALFHERDQLEAQVAELLAACKGASAALSQPVTFTRERSGSEHVRAYKILNADCATAREWLQAAIANVEGSK